MRHLPFVAALAATLCLAETARAVDQATLEKRVGEAVALYEEKGAGALCAAATDLEGPFLADEAYVFAFLRDGRLICHPRPDLNAMRRERSFVPDILRNTEARPNGAWTRYPWPHPRTLKIGLKSTYCRISRRLIVCAGAYFDAGSV